MDRLTGPNFLIDSGITKVAKNSTAYFGKFGGGMLVSLRPSWAILFLFARYLNSLKSGSVIKGVLGLCCCRERFDFAMAVTMSSLLVHL